MYSKQSPARTFRDRAFFVFGRSILGPDRPADPEPSRSKPTIPFGSCRFRLSLLCHFRARFALGIHHAPDDVVQVVFSSGIADVLIGPRL
jgi:hypothetical protein